MTEAPRPWTTPKAALAPSLRATGVGLHARLLFDRLPDLRTTTEALAWHITDRLPFPAPQWLGPEHSLLHVCLRHAFEAVDKALVGGETAGDELSVIYLRGLFYAIPELVNVRVRSGRGEVWAPLGDEPLTTWQAKSRGVEFEPELDVAVQASTLPPAKIRSVILSRTCPPSLLARMSGRIPEIVGT